MDQDKISNHHREPAIDASYQVSDYLAKRFQRRIFYRNQPIRNKNRLWWPCLLMDRDKLSNLYRGLPIDDTYQVSAYLVKRFQRRRLKWEKLTDDRRRTPSDGKSSHCLWQGELKTTSHMIWGSVSSLPHFWVLKSKITASMYKTA